MREKAAIGCAGVLIIVVLLAFLLVGAPLLVSGMSRWTTRINYSFADEQAERVREQRRRDAKVEHDLEADHARKITEILKDNPQYLDYLKAKGATIHEQVSVQQQQPGRRRIGDAAP